MNSVHRTQGHFSWMLK